jgi:hypothetical protein
MDRGILKISFFGKLIYHGVSILLANTGNAGTSTNENRLRKYWKQSREGRPGPEDMDGENTGNYDLGNSKNVDLGYPEHID